MINERNIAEKFSATWKQQFPLLTTNFIKVFNNSKIKTINTNPVPTKLKIRYDLVAEIAFNLTELTFSNTKTVKDILADNNILTKVIEQTAKSIWQKEKHLANKLILSSLEFQEIEKIVNNITEFINIKKINELHFKPKLKGYSFISDLEADLLIDDTLFEIKTVNRNYSASDLKQLFIYLALRQVDKSKTWKYAGLYNPRKGTYCKFNVKSLIYTLSGGRSTNEVFEDLLNGLVRDIQLDSKF